MSRLRSTQVAFAHLVFRCVELDALAVACSRTLARGHAAVVVRHDERGVPAASVQLGPSVTFHRVLATLRRASDQGAQATDPRLCYVHGYVDWTRGSLAVSPSAGATGAGGL